MCFGHYFFYPIKSCRNNYKKIPIKSCRISIKILNMIFPLNRVVIILKNPNKTCRIEKKFPNISSKNFFLTPIKSCRARILPLILVLLFYGVCFALSVGVTVAKPLNVALTSPPCAELNVTTPLKNPSPVVAFPVAPGVWLVPVSLNHTTI